MAMASIAAIMIDDHSNNGQSSKREINTGGGDDELSRYRKSKGIQEFNINGTKVYARDYKNALRKAKNAAKEKDNKMKWISVNTEKPPLTISNQYFMESEWVLVISNGVPMVSRFQKGQVRESRKWEQWFDPFGGYELRGVTHWAEIELPK